MILSNLDIQKALDEGDLVIDPEPQPRKPSTSNPSCPYDTCSVNLRLSPEIQIPRTGQPITFRPGAGAIAPFLAEIYAPRTIDPDGDFTLKPNTFILGRTVETIRLPIREGRPVYAGRVEGRSSFARLGLIVHFTAPTIHAGFEGTITLEMINLAPYPITFYPGMEICQLLIEPLSSPPFANPSQFHGQSSPAGTRG